MSYQIILKPSAKKELKKLKNKDKERIYQGLNIISKNPYQSKKLLGEYDGFYSFRVWPYRIIFFIYEKEKSIIIIKIAHRQGVYK